MTTQTVTGAVATRDRSDQLVSWIRKQQDDIAMAAASHIKPSAIVRVTQGALRRDDKLLAAAIANPQSLLYALLDCARLGHEPDTDDYYLVPFGSEVTGIEGYKGVIERMFRAGGVTSVVAQVVRQRDRYAPRGENTPPLHEYDDFASAEERGAMRGAYAYAIFTSGHCSQVIRMGRAEIMEHKAASRGSSRSDSPWQQWEPAMWKKTVLRGLEPYVPTSNEFRTANGMTPAAAAPAVFHRIEHDGASSSAEIVEAEIVDDPPPSNGRAAQEPQQPAARGRRKTAAAGDGTRSQPRAGRQYGGEPQRDADEHGADPAPEAAGAAPSREPQPLPPLPRTGEPAGQDERHAKLVGAVQGQLKRLGFDIGDDDREERVITLARLAQVAYDPDKYASTNDFEEDDLRQAATTLSRCKDRDALDELMKTGEVNG